MTLNQVRESYQNIINTEEKKYSRLNKIIFQIGTLRLIVVILCIVISYIFWKNTIIVVITLTLSILLFLLLMLFHNKLFRRRIYAEIKTQNAKDELKGMVYDFTPFDGASEYIDSNHSFSFDLDIFGNKSFFQSLNRTITDFGKRALSNIILYPFIDKGKILLQQESIRELSSKQEFIIHFRTVGKIAKSDDIDIRSFSKSFDQPSLFWGKKCWKFILYLIPFLYLIWVTLFILNIVNGNSFLYLWLATLLFSSLQLKKTHKISMILEKKSAMLEKYSDLLQIIENEEFDSQLLKDSQLSIYGRMNASKAIKQLKSHLDNIQLSVTFPVFLLLNPILLWNVRYAILIEKWMSENEENIKKWFDTLANFDALVSLSIFAYNHPDYKYPNIADSFVFEARQLGHPMIRREVCVRNDVNIIKQPYFLVVTGANMAGKSTFLRTIGINHIMGCSGLPVCAESLYLYPVNIITNLRTADSLTENESYFFAELKRLKFIIDKLQSGEKLLIILDEILKGTNSEDKQKGSFALMRQLIKLNGVGVIATHDLTLGILEEEYPDNVKNYRFEADMMDNHLSFTYKIQEGIAQNMNASFLMKKMGITEI